MNILAKNGFGLGGGGCSLRPGLVLCEGGVGGTGFFPSHVDGATLSPLGSLSISTLPLQLDWLLVASRLASMLELSSRAQLLPVSVATVWLRGFFSGSLAVDTLGAGPGGLAMVLA